MRLRRIKGIEEKIKEYGDVIVFDPTSLKGKWKERFNNTNPIYLEIGMGKGNFICKSAKLNPDINYIGCEISDSVAYLASKKIRGTSNILVINSDAMKLDEIFSEGEISKIYLNFSDPWPKKKHEKRRLTSKMFLDKYKELLGKGREIELKSDNRHFFEYSVMMFNKEGFEIEELSLDLHSDYSDVVTTEYEDKFTSLNQPIYYVKVRIK